MIDFQFIINDLIYFVEYNGLQHYEPVRFGGRSKEKAIEALKKQQIRDARLRTYCSENNIILIEIDSRKITFDSIEFYLKNNIHKKD